MTKVKGRGVFATGDIKEDELLVVEKPISYVSQIQKLTDI